MDLSERGESSARHPWEVVRSDFFLRLVDRYAPHSSRALDVGAGDSWFGEQLGRTHRMSEVVCWDHAYTPEELSEAPENIVRTVDRPRGEFDLVFLLDVLEHIEDPVRFLDEDVRPLVAAGAHVIASVPAHPWLFGPHDVALGHHRRYVPGEFVEQVAGLCPVLAHGPLFVTLAPVRALEVQWARRRRRHPSGPGVGNWTHGPVVTSLVTAVLQADAATCRGVAGFGLPVRGLSHWAVARMDAAA